MPTIRELLDQSARQALLDAPGPIHKGTLYGVVDFKAAKAGDDGKLYFEGYANTVNIDRQRHIVLPKAFRKTIKGFLKNNPQVFYNHDWNVSIGGIESAEIDEQGLKVRGYVQPATDENGVELFGSWGEFLRMVRGQVKRGQIRTLSIGFRIVESEKKKRTEDKTEVEYLEIREVDLMEVSLVTVPANRESVIQVQKGLAALYGDDVATQIVHLDGSEPDTESETPIHDLATGLRALGIDPERLSGLLQFIETNHEGVDADIVKQGAEPPETEPAQSGADDLQVVSLREVRETPRLIAVSLRRGESHDR